MASGRMFSKQFVDSDLFAFLTVAAQCLYFQMSMSADDDGFVSSVRRIIRCLNLNEEVLNELKAVGLIYEFSSGVCLIIHWHLNNKISPTKHKDTTFVNEKAQVSLGDDKVYYINTNQPNSYLRAQNRVGEVSEGEVNSGQVRLVEVSVGEIIIEQDSTGEDSIGEVKINAPTPVRYGMFNNVILTAEKYNKLVELYPSDYRSKIDRLSSHMYSTGKEYKDHFDTIVRWEIQDRSANNKKQNKGSTSYSSNAFKRVLETGEVSND